MSTAATSRRDLFRNRALLGVLLRDVVSTTGSQMTWVALPWFVLTTTGSPTRMTIVLAVEAFAVAIGGFFGGNLATKLGPRRTMLVADASRAPLMAAIPVLHLAGMLSFPVLLALTAAVGVFATPSYASKTVLLPDLVGEDEARLSQANALLQTANRTTLILGPPFAGVLIGVFGATEVLLFDAATFVVGFLVVAALVPASRSHAQEDEPVDKGIGAGFRFLFRDRLLRGWSAALVLGDVVWLSLFASIPVLVIDRFGEHPAIVGWIFAGFGIGAVVGSVVSFRLSETIDRMLLVSLGELGMALPLWLFVLHVPPVVLVTAMALAGLANGLVNAPLHTIVLLRTPRALRTKLWSAVIAATMLLGPLALIGTGPALEHYGVDRTLVVLLAIESAAVLLFTWTGLRHRAATRAGARARDVSSVVTRTGAAPGAARPVRRAPRSSG